MKQMILYGSKYGTSRKYALELSRQTGVQAFSRKEAPSLREVDRLIYVGGLYAGTVLGLKKALRKGLAPNGELFAVTVGIGDPADPGTAAFIDGSLQKQIPSALWPRTRVFHLRGALDYSTMTHVHRMMMAMLCRSVRSKAPEKQTPADHLILDSYGKQLDLTDLQSLEPVAAAMAL